MRIGGFSCDSRSAGFLHLLHCSRAVHSQRLLCPLRSAASHSAYCLLFLLFFLESGLVKIALAEDPGSIPSMHVVWPAVARAPGNQLLCSLLTPALVCKHPHTNISKNNKDTSFK